MIKAVRIKNEHDENIGFQLTGHADYAKRGKDIVCAATSALVVNTINSIENFTDDKFSFAEDEKSGLMEFIIVSDVSSESALLMDSLFLGLQLIEHEYGKKFITVRA